LIDRPEGAIERKHQNISAVMRELGRPWISGYKPLGNYQALLERVVIDQLASRPELDRLMQSAVELPAVVPTTVDFSKVRTDNPVWELEASESAKPPQFKAAQRDYLAREASNTSLGLAGEEFVLQYEHWRLYQLGQKRLAEQVEHVSKTKGDGLGYDVRSFDADGRDRYIEVKTTSFGKQTPFYVSGGELSFSKQATDQFHLYRLFEFRKKPQLFDLMGRLDLNCRLDPVSYRADFG
jgi:hypothetical protein